MKQPFIYAVCLGVLVFVLDHFLTKEASSVVVTDGVRQQVVSAVGAALGRAPTDGEIHAALQTWQDDEVLYREALALDLVEGDPVVRLHLANKLRQIVRERTLPRAASEADLQGLFQAERAAYVTQPSYDVRLGYFANLALGAADGRARAEAALAQLLRGEQPADASNHFPRGPDFNGATRAFLEGVFQADLTALLAADNVGRWQLLSAPRGFFVLSLRQIHSGAPDFEAVRPALAARFEELQKQQALEAFLARARRKYDLGPLPH